MSFEPVTSGYCHFCNSKGIIVAVMGGRFLLKYACIGCYVKNEDFVLVKNPRDSLMQQAKKDREAILGLQNVSLGELYQEWKNMGKEEEYQIEPGAIYRHKENGHLEWWGANANQNTDRWEFVENHPLKVKKPGPKVGEEVTYIFCSSIPKMGESIPLFSTKPNDLEYPYKFGLVYKGKA